MKIVILFLHAANAHMYLVSRRGDDDQHWIPKEFMEHAVAMQGARVTEEFTENGQRVRPASYEFQIDEHLAARAGL